ncbi:type VI secretion system tube protein TssD [Dysgonomonas sp. GY617]|uniref:type VI secretion system tube protein TssD n=1 Tax=Dysgonomonas sp. GY617 TaxID=2780420 RepID=UPI001883ABDA|nr:type VI secretion system tube protein TssD [Dysgonomonas sp. GY617]MBF0578092.1 type VI secretion system needle protein Hcp [Dysgonomonas sp. GY617]
MFSHKCYLKIGELTGTDFSSLLKSGYELDNFEYGFQQGVDNTGKAATEVYGGTLTMTMAMLPPDSILEWALNSRKYKNGAIIILNEQGTQPDKLLFENAACVDMSLDYTQKGKAYITTKIVLQAERLIFNNGFDFDNFWTK